MKSVIGSAVTTEGMPTLTANVMMAVSRKSRENMARAADAAPHPVAPRIRSVNAESEIARLRMHTLYNGHVSRRVTLNPSYSGPAYVERYPL